LKVQGKAIVLKTFSLVKNKPNFNLRTCPVAGVNTQDDDFIIENHFWISQGSVVIFLKYEGQFRNVKLLQNSVYLVSKIVKIG